MQEILQALATSPWLALFGGLGSLVTIVTAIGFLRTRASAAALLDLLNAEREENIILKQRCELLLNSSVEAAIEVIVELESRGDYIEAMRVASLWLSEHRGSLARLSEGAASQTLYDEDRLPPSTMADTRWLYLVAAGTSDKQRYLAGHNRSVELLNSIPPESDASPNPLADTPSPAFANVILTPDAAEAYLEAMQPIVQGARNKGDNLLALRLAFRCVHATAHLVPPDVPIMGEITYILATTLSVAGNQAAAYAMLEDIRNLSRLDDLRTRVTSTQIEVCIALYEDAEKDRATYVSELSRLFRTLHELVQKHPTNYFAAARLSALRGRVIIERNPQSAFEHIKVADELLGRLYREWSASDRRDELMKHQLDLASIDTALAGIIIRMALKYPIAEIVRSAVSRPEQWSIPPDHPMRVSYEVILEGLQSRLDAGGNRDP